MDAPIVADWDQLAKLVSDRIGWRKRVHDLKTTTTRIEEPRRKSSVRIQRLSPLKMKKRNQMRGKNTSQQ